MVMDFREYYVSRENDELVIVGVIRDPVHWDFSMRFCEDDYPAILQLVLNRHTLMAVLRSLFRRRKKHHWGCEPKEHYAQGQNMKRLIGPEVESRMQTALSPIEQKPKRRRRSGVKLLAGTEQAQQAKPIEMKPSAA
jgi:hypothetical protein